MNQSQHPFDNWSVRAAVVHAINYSEVINLGFGGLASQWVGPVPPGYPYYNPDNLSAYPFNLTLAKQEMANSPWPNGYPNAINYEYLNLGDWPNVALLLKNDLAKIGLNLNLVAVSNIPNLLSLQTIDPSTGQCTSQESPNTAGGPFPMGQEFYTSDYISPDDWTQNNAISYGSANACMSGFANTTVDNLVIAAAGEHNDAKLKADYAQITQLMYNNYTDAWLAVPTTFQVYNSQLSGIVSNPMGSTVLYTMYYSSMTSS
jgi:peptide/nickel transport system substrate-binding protein